MCNRTQVIKDTLRKTVDDILTPKDKIQGLPTGFDELDDLTGGFKRGSLSVIAGHPGIGKTALGLQIAEHLAIDNDMAVLFFSMQHSCQQLVERLLLSRSRIDYRLSRTGKLNESQSKNIRDNAEKISTKQLLINDTLGLCPAELRKIGADLSRHHSLQCIIIDSLHNMPAENALELGGKDFTQIARALNLIAQEMCIPVLLLAELKMDRILKLETDNGKDNKPEMTDLGDAIVLHRYADLFMMINRDSYYFANHSKDIDAEIVITINRQGYTGTVPLIFHRGFARFENVTKKFKNG